MLTHLLGRLGLDVAIRQYAAVSFRPSDVPVAVKIHGSFGVIDGAQRCSVVSLAPLRLAVTGLTDAAFVHALTFENARGARFGDLRLARAGRCGPRGEYVLCSVEGHHNYCVNRIELATNYLRYASSAWLSGSPDRFRLFGANLWSLLVFYIRPRPVVIVSVSDRDGQPHLFPMDLVGHAPGGTFLMALRSTNLSVASMGNSRRVAMCEVPASFASTAYDLAAAHKVRRRAAALPFEVTSSPTWRLPLPAAGVRIREVEILHVEQVGSHHLFTTRVIHDVDSGQPRLHHVCGFAEGLVKRADPALTT
jgi:hypothetical protein